MVGANQCVLLLQTPRSMPNFNPPWSTSRGLSGLRSWLKARKGEQLPPGEEFFCLQWWRVFGREEKVEQCAESVFLAEFRKLSSNLTTKEHFKSHR
jgi:hypothetical protein